MFLLDVTCGDGKLVMNEMIPNLTSTIINIIKIGVPLLLVVFGMIDLGKSVMAQKEDEIKKGQQTFVKRLVAAILVFLVVFVVQTVVGVVAPKDNNTNMWNCVDCFLDGASKCADPVITKGKAKCNEIQGTISNDICIYGTNKTCSITRGITGQKYCGDL